MAVIRNSDGASLNFNSIMVDGRRIGNEVTLDFQSIGKANRYKDITKSDVERALSNRNIIELRRISDTFFMESGIYSRLCRYMAYLFKYDWVMTPIVNNDKVKDESVVDGFRKTSLFIENSKVKNLFGNIALKVVKNGCYYGYLVDSTERIVIQELPANYCRVRYEVNGMRAVEFNIKFFDDSFNDPEYRMRVLKMFPNEFKRAYVSWKEGNLKRDFVSDDEGWFLLQVGHAFKFNLSDSDYPLFVSIIPHLIDLSDAQDIDKQKMAQQLLRLLVQKLPRDKNDELIFDMDEGRQLHQNAVQMLANTIGIDVLTTPLDVNVEDLSDNSNVSSVDQLEKVERTVYNEAGVSQMQFNTDGNLALEKSIANDEATMSDLLSQFEAFGQACLGRFNNKPNRIYYKFQLLPTTVYNYKDIAKLYKEQAMLGFSKVLAPVALGQSQTSVIAAAKFENQIMHLNEVFIPPQMSSTISAGEISASANKKNPASNSGKGEAGRPELDDSEKSDKTIQNRESMS